MNKIKGILFDKDGTLIDFHSVWVPTAYKLVDMLIEEFGGENLKLRLLSVIGVENGRVVPDGVLASGTTHDIAVAFESVIGDEVKLQEWTMETLLRLTKHHIDFIRPTGDLKALFDTLTLKGLCLGVATADDYATTNICLEKLEIGQYFSFIGTSDRFEKKPNPSMLQAFCQKNNLHPSEVAVVGDTIVDLMLAKNGAAGLAIGVLTGASHKEKLDPLADFVVSSINDLILLDEKFIWE